MTDQSITYPIRTLADIYNLPSYECMERCLDEMVKLLLESRAMEDALTASMAITRKVDFATIGRTYRWPETVDWTDDGKGELGAIFKDPSGEPAFSFNIRKDSK